MQFIYIECALSSCSRFNDRFLTSKWRMSLLLLFFSRYSVYEYNFIWYFGRSYLKIQLFEFLVIYCLENYLPLTKGSWGYFYSIHVLLFDWINYLNSFKIYHGQFSGGHLELRLNTLYDGVETLVLFIGHARSGHSLIRAILDAQTEIIHEYKLIGEWSNFKLKSSSGLKTRVLFALHALSRFQAMFGNRAASRRSGGGYSYSVPGQW